MPQELSEQVDRLASAIRRSRSWIVEEAVREYVAKNAWQVEAIQEALEDYNSGQAELVDHDDVMREMEALEAQIEADVPPGA